MKIPMENVHKRSHRQNCRSGGFGMSRRGTRNHPVPSSLLEIKTFQSDGMKKDGPNENSLTYFENKVRLVSIMIQQTGRSQLNNAQKCRKVER